MKKQWICRPKYLRVVRILASIPVLSMFVLTVPRLVLEIKKNTNSSDKRWDPIVLKLQSSISNCR